MKTYFYNLPLFSYFKDNNDTLYQRISLDTVQDANLGSIHTYLTNPKVTHLFNVPVVTNKFIVYKNKKGQRHRLDGPAVQWNGGMEQWFKDEKLHRLDGPAFVHPRVPSRNSYYIDGIRYESYFEYLVAAEIYKQKQLTLQKG